MGWGWTLPPASRSSCASPAPATGRFRAKARCRGGARIQEETGRAVAAFQAIAAEAKGERRVILWQSRIPLRWRGPCSGCATTSSSSGGRPRRRSRKNSPSVSVRRSRAWPNARAHICMKAQARFFSPTPPPLKPMEEALAAYNLEIAALRSEGLTRGLSIAGAEQLFTLGFALERMPRDCADLERCVRELARPSPLDRAGEG